MGDVALVDRVDLWRGRRGEFRAIFGNGGMLRVEWGRAGFGVEGAMSGGAGFV